MLGEQSNYGILSLSAQAGSARDLNVRNSEGL
jgi:hypothetical protein